MPKIWNKKILFIALCSVLLSNEAFCYDPVKTGTSTTTNEVVDVCQWSKAARQSNAYDGCLINLANRVYTAEQLCNMDQKYCDEHKNILRNKDVYESIRNSSTYKLFHPSDSNKNSYYIEDPDHPLPPKNTYCEYLKGCPIAKQYWDVNAKALGASTYVTDRKLPPLPAGVQKDNVNRMFSGSGNPFTGEGSDSAKAEDAPSTPTPTEDLVAKTKAAAQYKEQDLQAIKQLSSVLEARAKILKQMQPPEAPDYEMASTKRMDQVQKNYERQLQLFKDGQNKAQIEIDSLRQSIQKAATETAASANDLKMQAAKLASNQEALTGATGLPKEADTKTGLQAPATNSPTANTEPQTQVAENKTDTSPAGTAPGATPAPNADATDWAGIMKGSLDGAKMIADAAKGMKDDSKKDDPAKSGSPAAAATTNSGVGPASNGPGGGSSDKNTTSASQNEVAQKTNDNNGTKATGASKDDAPLKEQVKKSLEASAENSQFKNPKADMNLDESTLALLKNLPPPNKEGEQGQLAAGGQITQNGAPKDEIGALDAAGGGSRSGGGGKGGLLPLIPDLGEGMKNMFGGLFGSGEAITNEDKKLGTELKPAHEYRSNRSPASVETVAQAGDDQQNIPLFERVNHKMIDALKRGNLLGPKLDFEKR